MRSILSTTSTTQSIPAPLSSMSTLNSFQTNSPSSNGQRLDWESN